MGFLEWLFGKIECPRCGTKGAKESAGRIRCPNPSCAYFDSSLGRRGTLRKAGTKGARRSDFSPARPLTIRYRNFRGEEKTFTADAESVERKRNHISARVVPTGEPIFLSRDRILNLSEVESALTPRLAPGPEGPTARERHVLNFHKKRGSTSPRYEALRAKYPNW